MVGGSGDGQWEVRGEGRNRCSHGVALPEGQVALPGDDIWWPTIDDKKLGKPRAKAYPFHLDAFQEVSIACLERQESVMVAAHTSSGKTVVAEYAIAMAFRDNQRVIYTSPLKALSNQKFKELSDEFKDVGLMTGDTSINPNATCLVMTTEIMRAMIYKGSEVLREVAWVIFDEVHYMRDRERGVVWEESIIFAPPGLKMVFLSATLSNANEFVDWIAHLRKAPCHVVYTDHRVVPLEHYAYPQNGDGIYLVCDGNGRFRDDNVELMLGTVQAKKKLKSSVPKGSKEQKKTSGSGGDVLNVVRLVKDKDYIPVIVFSFSRRECEEYAREAAKQFTFVTPEESEIIETVYNNAIATLAEEDRTIPPIERMLPLLKGGIGIHHSGLMPVIKELVEILFQEGLIKALFATETFAMGLNMPARTVVFTQVKKWDGEENRWLTSGEYIQMSGRAGRRGKDDRGITIIMVDDQCTDDGLATMIQGKPSPLLSTFRLSYYSLLNLISRPEGLYTTEYSIANSFHQFQHEKELPQLKERLVRIEAELANLNAVVDAATKTDDESNGGGGGGGGGDDDVTKENTNTILSDLRQLEVDMLRSLLRPKIIAPFLTSGRVLRVCTAEGADLGWGFLLKAALVNHKGKKKTSPLKWIAPKSDKYLLDVALTLPKGAKGKQRWRVPDPDEVVEMSVETIPLPLVTAVSAIRIKVPDDIESGNSVVGKELLAVMSKLRKTYHDDIPLLDPVKDMSLTEEEFAPFQARLARIQEVAPHNVKSGNIATSSASSGAPKTDVDNGNTKAKERIEALTSSAEEIKSTFRESHLSLFRGELRARSKVLKKLGHINEEGVIQMKGLCASQIDTADELLTSELMFDGTFSSLDRFQIAALASCLIPTDKTQEVLELKKNILKRPLESLDDAARRIAKLSFEYGLVDPAKEVEEDAYVEEYATKFNGSMVDVVYKWAKGASFAHLTQTTDIFEGSIARAMRSLDELLRQLSDAARSVGDKMLGDKFEEASVCIQRGIVFANSLYTTDA